MGDLSACMLFPGDPHFTSADTALSPCTEPSECTIAFACIHEHIDQPRACVTCAVEIQRCAPDLACPRCEDGTQPHECLCDVRITWDCDGSTTIVQELASA